MGLFSENYGALGLLPKLEWKRLLKSNQGLFIRRQKRAPNFVIGPTLSDSGKVIGDTESIEASYFGQIASKDQMEFWRKLSEVNPIAGDEYLLNIIGAIQVWKEDIKWLKIAYNYLKKEEHTLSKEKQLTEREEAINLSLKLPPILQRHFPHLFKDVDIHPSDFDSLLEKIRQTESRVKSKEHYILDYLNKIKKEKPFLFE